MRSRKTIHCPSRSKCIRDCKGFPGKCSTSHCTEQPWPQGVCLKWGCGSGATLALNLCPSCPASAVVGSSTYSPVPLGPAEPHHSPVLYLSCLTCVNGDNEMPVSEAYSEGFVRKPVASLGQPGAWDFFCFLRNSSL